MDFIYDGRAGFAEGIALVRNIRRDILPPVQPQMVKFGGKHGTYYFGHTYGERTILIDVVLAETSYQSLRERVRNLAAWLRPDDVRRLVFSDEPDKYYKAVLSGSTALEQLVAEGEGTLSFLCPDPFAYAITPQEINLLNEGSQSIVGDTLIVEHEHIQEGTMDALPLMEIRGVLTGDPQVLRITIAGHLLIYNGILEEGDILKLDSEVITAFRVREGQMNVLHLLDRPILPVFRPGVNPIIVEAISGAILTNFIIHCRNRWL